MSAVVEFLTQGAGMVVGFLVALVPLIIVHELGHMFTAKALGVWVREFGIGFPPRILKLFQWQETEFTLNWLPLGGFALMEGEAQMAEVEPGVIEVKTPEQLAHAAEAQRHSLFAQPPLRRLPIFFSGPLTNIILAWLLAIAIYIPARQVRISAVAPNSPAELAGIQAGDAIVSIGEQPVMGVQTVIDFVGAHLGVEIPLTVRRDNVDVALSLTPRANPPEGEGAIGIGLYEDIVSRDIQKVPFTQSIALGTRAFIDAVRQIARLPIDLISGVLPWAVARPIGIINISRLSYEVIQLSAESKTLIPILGLLMSVSLSLGIFNLLPVPALDGGHMLFTVVELVSRRALPPALQARIAQIALGVLLLIFVAITVLDILYPVSLLTP
ncbi:MAG: Regulator of sigma-W protease RasP [Chloroflexi bacterium ADurb.Bin360]|nr:MAG: Regulator of sigma-W protease RasP [Chloroflexi bacterium ADurb.Bin360]